MKLQEGISYQLKDNYRSKIAKFQAPECLCNILELLPTCFLTSETGLIKRLDDRAGESYLAQNLAHIDAKRIIVTVICMREKVKVFANI